MAAASSIASGSPSRRATISAIAGADAAVTSKSGRTARARSMNRCTPSNWESSASVGRWPRVRDPERRDRVLLLAAEVQAGAAGHEDPELRRGGEEAGDDRGGVLEVLEVVEHEEHVAIAQRVRDGVEERPFRGLADEERRRDRRRQQVGFRDRGELDEERPVAVSQEPLRRDLEREARLAGATRPGQRDEPGPVEERLDRGDLRLATDEGGELDGQVVGPRVEAPQGRETRPAGPPRRAGTRAPAARGP